MNVHPIDYRYGSDEMRKIFEEEARLRKMVEVEIALINALHEMGKVPESAYKEAAQKAKKVELKRVREIEKEVNHDVMAMVLSLSEQCSPETAKYIHLSATSYDIVDSALALQMKEALTIIIKKGKVVLADIIKIAEKHDKQIMIGRTHGQHATPITLGFKFANYAQKIGEDLDRLEYDMKEHIQGKFSGAVGNYSVQKTFEIDGLEEVILNKLEIKPAEISTQVVARENIARIVCDIAILAATLEQIAKEIRNLQRTEIGEVSEGFGKKQVGSSAMPQKRNPINCENICSNARVVRSTVYPVLENIALEHERDLTNSASERTILPTVFVITDDMLERTHKVLNTLEVYPQKMKQNVGITQGRIMAENVMSGLVKKGVERQKAHELLRKASTESLKQNKPMKEILKQDKELMKLITPEELEKMMDPEQYVGLAVEKIYKITKKWKKCL
ncbi:adenylosuccinate lyase [archaeon]|nr:adenylosuccinate lyase [archaeon]